MAGMNNAILNNVYSYYHHSFSPTAFRDKKERDEKTVERKGSLGGVYSKVRSIEKESPVFILDRSKEAKEYSLHMKESALKFRSSVANLGGLDQDEMFGKKSIYSSDESIADAKYYGEPKDSEEPASLTVLEIAKPQKNEGSFLLSDDIEVPPGTYSFDVTNHVSSYELQFTVTDSDTNLNIQKRLMRLINNSGIGITAKIEEDGYGLSALTLTSNTTGQNDGKRPFEISDEDTSQLKGIVDHLGIREVTEEASWAKYQINGQEKTSPTNDIVELGYLDIHLNKADAGKTVTLESKPDYESLKDNIKGLAASYNGFVRAVSEYLEKQPRTTLLVGSMKRMTASYGAAMKQFGMTQSEDGTLEVDEKALSEGLLSENASDSLQSIKDFTKTALTKASQVQLNPMNYADKKIVAYKNPFKEHFPNPYVTSSYTGMMFNSYM